MPQAATPSRLARRLGTTDAVAIGLGSMIGAGIFAAVGPASQAAGSGITVALLIAGAVAFANATSSAQLAAVYPESGGTYVYGRERLGAYWGFLAGWGFVIGKTASCAAMALTLGLYVAPGSERIVALAAIAILTAVNCRGIQKTAVLTKVVLAIVLSALAVVVASGLGSRGATLARLEDVGSGGVTGILQAAGLLFFAFAGYARIATLGEEVRDPSRTIPRAIPIALAITLAVYAAVLAAALVSIGPDQLGRAEAPLRDVVEGGPLSELTPIVRIGGAAAALSVLLSLIVGVSRTGFAMASRGELPRVLAAVHPRFHVPHRAEVTVGIAAALVVVIADVRGAIGFSAFAVLVYYAIANASAWTLPPLDRRWPRWLCAAGLGGCLLLAALLPRASILGGLAVLLAGSGVWLVRQRQHA